MKPGKYILTTASADHPKLKLGQEYILRKMQTGNSSSFSYALAHLALAYGIPNPSGPKLSIYKSGSNSIIASISAKEAPKYFEESHKEFDDKLKELLET